MTYPINEKASLAGLAVPNNLQNKTDQNLITDDCERKSTKKISGFYPHIDIDKPNFAPDWQAGLVNGNGSFRLKGTYNTFASARTMRRMEARKAAKAARKAKKQGGGKS
jgi:hypothetical protein